MIQSNFLRCCSDLQVACYIADVHLPHSPSHPVHEHVHSIHTLQHIKLSKHNIHWNYQLPTEKFCLEVQKSLRPSPTVITDDAKQQKLERETNTQNCHIRKTTVPELSCSIIKSIFTVCYANNQCTCESAGWHQIIISCENDMLKSLLVHTTGPWLAQAYYLLHG